MPLIDLQTAAEVLGYSVSGLRKLVKRGEIRSFQARPHSPLKFKREWLDEYIERNSQPRGVGATIRRVKKKKPQFDCGLGFDSSLLDL